MQLTSGTLLERGRYRIIETLGRGGFGVTYLAEQVMAKRKVCIKEFFPQDYYKRDGDTGALTLSSDGFAESMNRFKAKFIKEAQTIATLNHANIIPIYDVFEENGTAYYVMEFVEGESLSDIVKRSGAMSEGDAMVYIKQVASALAHIHEQQIVHLDIKPGNIMVRSKENHAILIDFALSKHYDFASGEATPRTPVGVSHGFAPMEQYQYGGVSTFSPETDIYSLGATLYFLVTGNVPPQATVVAEQGLPNLEGLSSNIRETIAKSMSYLRKDRPHTIKDFLALLDNKRPVAAVLAAESKKTKITQKPKIQPAVEQPKPKPKTYLELELELEHEQKRSRWWMWLLGLLLIGCGAWFIYGDNNTEDVALPEISTTYKIGDYYNVNGKKGVVFEVWDGGRHGKIVSLGEAQLAWDLRVDVNDDYEEWINGTKTGANSYSDGKANTDRVMSRADSRYFEAFVWCRNKGADWYLPAVDELKAIYNNQSAINSTLAEYGAQLTNGWHWSSTESEYDPEFGAWFVSLGNGNTYPDYKLSNGYVRAVSAF